MNTFKQKITNMYGDKGKQWLANLPKLIQHSTQNWLLTDLNPVDSLSYNYVISGLQNNQPIILKLGIDVEALNREALALKAFAGFGAIKVLGQHYGALLLERAVPGNSLKDYFPTKDEEAMHITCRIMKKLHQAPLSSSNTFPHIHDWLAVIDKDWNIPINYLIKARNLKDQLLNTCAKPVLLHGDLHHANILKNSTGWVVIDPKGVLGYPVNEVWAFVRNPLGKLPMQRIVKRVKYFADCLDLNYELTINWCFVQSVLSWIWDIEDNLEPSTMYLTKIFDTLKIS